MEEPPATAKEEEEPELPPPADFGRIAALPADAVARISAGQVVSDAAAAVKELVENALDAGAFEVAVDLGESLVMGGFSSGSSNKGSLTTSGHPCGLATLTVSDTGSGIAPADFALVARPHCTSKLADFKDLSSQRLRTLGFRGEALASLCDVSGEVKFETRRREDHERQQPQQQQKQQQEAQARERLVPGASVVLGRDGTVTKVDLAEPGPPGTVFTVRGLFSVFPARLERIRKDARIQQNKILSLLTAFALVRPKVEFVLRCAGGDGVSRASSSSSSSGAVTRTLLHRKACAQVADSIKQVFGQEILDSLTEVRLDYDTEGGPDGSSGSSISSVYAFLPARVEPDHDRPTRGVAAFRSSSERFQFFFVNGRPVDLPELTKLFNAHLRSYFTAYARSQFPASAGGKKYPFVFLHITADPSAFDINYTADKRRCVFVNKSALVEDIWEILDGGYALPEAEAVVEGEEEEPGAGGANSASQFQLPQQVGSQQQGLLGASQASLGSSGFSASGSSVFASTPSRSRAVPANQPQIDSLFGGARRSPNGSNRGGDDQEMLDVSSPGSGAAPSQSTSHAKRKHDTVDGDGEIHSGDSKVPPAGARRRLAVDLEKMQRDNDAIDALDMPEVGNSGIIGRLLTAELQDLVLFHDDQAFGVFSPARVQEKISLGQSFEQKASIRVEGSMCPPLTWEYLTTHLESVRVELERFGLFVVSLAGTFIDLEVPMDLYSEATLVASDLCEVVGRVSRSEAVDSGWRPRAQKTYWIEKCANDAETATRAIRNMPPGRQAGVLKEMLKQSQGSCVCSAELSVSCRCACIHGNTSIEKLDVVRGGESHPQQEQ